MSQVPVSDEKLRYYSDGLITESKAGDLEAVRELIGNGASVNYSTLSGTTALMHAADNGHTEIARIILGKSPDVNAADKNGATALIGASSNGHLEIVKLLVENGASVNIRGKTPDQDALMVASDYGRTEVVRFLLDNGADPNSHDSDGYSVLMAASAHNHLETVKVLLDRGANIDAVDDVYGSTALMRAFATHSNDVSAELVNRGADSDTIINKYGKTATDIMIDKLSEPDPGEPTKDQQSTIPASQRSAESDTLREELNLHMSDGQKAFERHDWKTSEIEFTTVASILVKLRKIHPDIERFRDYYCMANGNAACSRLNLLIESNSLPCYWSKGSVFAIVSSLLNVYEVNPQEEYMLGLFGKLVDFCLNSGRSVGFSVPRSMPSPDEWENHCKLGFRAINHQSWSEAIYHYQEAIRIDGGANSSLFTELGLALYSAGRQSEGVGAFKKGGLTMSRASLSVDEKTLMSANKTLSVSTKNAQTQEDKDRIVGLKIMAFAIIAVILIYYLAC
ncbi:MAG: ankyrin repeat domain-containing protein [Parcubacteria group bacterium]|nr:ankyrin repeat domain-containing protein [Parcubacteria group bacterium]